MELVDRLKTTQVSKKLPSFSQYLEEWAILSIEYDDFQDFQKALTELGSYQDLQHDVLLQDLPGWSHLVTLHHGKQLAHTLLAFFNLIQLPDYHNLQSEQQDIIESSILFHDIGKQEDIPSRDYLHPQRSCKYYLDFYLGSISEAKLLDNVYETLDLSEIKSILSFCEVVDELVEQRVATISKYILLHQVVSPLPDWPQKYGIDDAELPKLLAHVDLGLMRIHFLADSSGWNYYQPELDQSYSHQIRQYFDRIEQLN